MANLATSVSTLFPCREGEPEALVSGAVFGCEECETDPCNASSASTPSCDIISARKYAKAQKGHGRRGSEMENTDGIAREDNFLSQPFDLDLRNTKSVVRQSLMQARSFLTSPHRQHAARRPRLPHGAQWEKSDTGAPIAPTNSIGRINFDPQLTLRFSR